jgi:hypothetical protein
MLVLAFLAIAGFDPQCQLRPRRQQRPTLTKGGHYGTKALIPPKKLAQPAKWRCPLKNENAGFCDFEKSPTRAQFR